MTDMCIDVGHKPESKLQNVLAIYVDLVCILLAIISVFSKM